MVPGVWAVWGSWWHEERRIGASPARVTLIRERAAQSADHLAKKWQKWAVMGEVVCDLSESGKASPLQPPPSPPGLPPVALRSPLHVKTHNAARVTHLPGDHSQVGWLPPSCVTCHYFEKDPSPLTRGTLRTRVVADLGIRIIPAHAGNTPCDLCKHHTAQTDYGSAVERLPPTYSFYHTPYNQGSTTRKSSQTQIRAATSTSDIQPMKAASAALRKLVPRILVPSDHPGIWIRSTH